MLKTLIMKAAFIAFVSSISFAAHAIADTQRFDIPAGDLIAALESFAKQADVDLVYQDEQVKGLQTGGVSGEFSPREAVMKLLEGTPLQLRTDVASGALLITTPLLSSGPASTSATEDQPKAAAGADSAAVREKRSFWDRFRLAQAETNPASEGQLSESQTSERDNSHRSSEEAERNRIVLDEIIVTAQKREERLQDVPISISVLGGADLDRSTAKGLAEALRSVPGVAVIEGSLGGGTLLNVRGVSATNPILTGSSPVGYYLDSVPFSLVRSAAAPDSSAYDLERVEVLRGPQGTLYGASSANGVVRILTKDADLDEFELKGRTSGSNTKDGSSNYRGDVAINVPLIAGKLGARAVVGYENLSGWIDRPNREDANDAELLNMRLKVNAQPTDELSVGLSAWLSRNDYDSRSTGTENRTNISLVEEPISTDYDALGLKIGYDFPAFSLSSMTSYLDYENDSVLDYQSIFGGNAICCLDTVLDTGFDSRIFSQEINLASTTPGAWRWTLGGIYRDGTDRFFQWRRQYVNPNGNRFSDSSESFAVFGELTRIFLDDRLELTGGLRYFEDQQKMQETSRLSQIVPNPPFFDREEEFDALSPRVTLTWHPSNRVTTYASYAEGFRSGFSQISGVLVSDPDFPPVDADNLTNYELGAKGTLWDGRLSFDTAVYYIDWQDIQQSISVRVDSGGTLIPLSAPINGESASGLGFELGLAARPISGLELGLNFGWNDLTLDAQVITARLFGGGDVVLFEKGDRLVLSPEYTAGASADYSFPIGASGYKGRFSAAANYISEMETRTVVTALVLATGDDMLISRAGFGVSSPGDRWSATLFVENLGDEKSVFSPSATPVENVRIRPRTAGLQFEFRF